MPDGDIVSELRSRLAITGGTDEGEYVVESQATGVSKSVEAAVGPQVFLLRTQLKLRQGAELTYELAGDGTIRGGARVVVLESRTLLDGTERKRLAYEGHEEPCGWVSALLNGMPNLLTEAEAQAAHAASLAAAITGQPVTPPAMRPIASAPLQKSQKKLPAFGGGGEKCQFCGKTAYQAERTQVGDYFFHVKCMHCVVCGPNKRLGSEYGVAANAEGVWCLYCAAHEVEARGKYPQPSYAVDNKEGAADAQPISIAASIPVSRSPALFDAATGPPSTAVITPSTANSSAAKPVGLGTTADRELEEALKRAPSSGRGAPPVRVDDTNPLTRCLQCLQTHDGGPTP